MQGGPIKLHDALVMNHKSAWCSWLTVAL